MFYSYDFGEVAARFRWEYDRFFYERWCREAIAALLAHPERTDDPEQADFYVVTPTLRCVPFASVASMASVLLGDGLPYFGNGKPHVYFDLRDSPQPLMDGPQIIVCKSAFHKKYYDPKAGVPIPQFPRFRFDRPILPASQRRHLAGFKGNPRPQYGDLRLRILGLDNGERFVMKGGVVEPTNIEISESGQVREVVSPGDWSHTEIMFNSTFAILPRACGYALSYRMIECMNAGCVPVIISDGYVLPFSDELDYDRFSIRVTESEVEWLPEILDARFADANALQENAMEVYRTHFASTELIIGQTMRQVTNRVQSRSPTCLNQRLKH